MAGKAKTLAGITVVEMGCERCVGPQNVGPLRDRALASLKGASPRLIFDISTCEAVDGACLAVLVAATNEYPPDTVAVVVGTAVRETLEEWSLDEAFRMFGTREEAVDFIEGRS